jgi:hypothetical protein
MYVCTGYSLVNSQITARIAQGGVFCFCIFFWLLFARKRALARTQRPKWVGAMSTLGASRGPDGGLRAEFFGTAAPRSTTPGGSSGSRRAGGDASPSVGGVGGGSRHDSNSTNKQPTTFEELNSILRGRHSSLSHRINSVLSVLENNRDNLRGFFSACYQPLLWSIFNFDDGASGWLQSVSAGRQDRNSEREAWMLIDLLSPTGPLMKAVLAADADGLMQFAFPLERLPVRTQRRLQTDPALLNQRLPYRNCVQRDAQGRFHVHLGLYHYFLFWSAYYACSEARGSVSAGLANDRRGHGRQGSPYGSGSGRPQWMDSLLGGSQKIHPYRELLLSHLEYFLPRGTANIGRGKSPGMGARGAAGWSRPSELFYRAGNVSQGEMLVSIMIEFWLPGIEEPLRATGGYYGAGDASRSPYGVDADGRSRGFAVGSRYGDPTGLQQQYSYYSPPNDDLVNAVSLLTSYLFAETSDEGSKKQKTGMMTDGERLSPRSPPASGGSNTPFARGSVRRTSSPADREPDSAEEVERAKEMLQKPLYRFLCEAFTQWPTESTASLSPLLTLWVTYLTPWTLEFPKPFRPSRTSASSTSTLSRGLEAVTAAATERKPSSPAFADDSSPISGASGSRGGRKGRSTRLMDKTHILHNVPFYCELMRHFLELCCKRVPVDAEGTANALLNVLRVLASNPEMLDLLEDMESAYNKFTLVDPYAPPTPNMEPPPPTPYDAFLPFIKSQILDWDPPEMLAGEGVSEMQVSTPTRHGRAGYAAVPPAVVPKLSMFSLDQEGQAQIVLALLERLDRDMSVVGPSHPLRKRVPKLRNSAFSVFRLDRLGEEATRRTNTGGGSRNATEMDQSATPGAQRPKIGWARLDKSKANAKGLYQGDWLHRPISDMEFPPLARLLITATMHVREVTGDTRITLRPIAEYGSMLLLLFFAMFIWIFFC